MLEPWIKCTTTTTGTGDLTLASVTGFPQVSDAFVDGESFVYAILDDTGKPIEIGMGRLSSGALVRAKIYATFSGGTYTDDGATAVSLAAGTKTVIITPDGQTIAQNWPALSSTSTANNKVVIPSNYSGVSANSFTWATQADRVHYYPIYIPCKVKVDAFVFRCGAVVASPNDIMDFGLYSVDDSGKPRTKIIEAVNKTVTAALNYHALAASTQIRAGWYFAAINTKSTGNTSRVGSMLPGFMGNNATTGEFSNCYTCTEDRTAGTLPATATALDPRQGVNTGTNEVPIIGLRWV